MGEKHWKDRWDDAAQTEYDRLGALSIEELIRRIRANELGDYYTIWDAVAAKKDLPAVGWQLYDFVTSSADYLQRYHCARVLLGLLSCDRYEAADLTVAHRQPATALAEVQRLLERAIGPRLPAI